MDDSVGTCSGCGCSIMGDESTCSDCNVPDEEPEPTPCEECDTTGMTEDDEVCEHCNGKGEIAADGS